jgi:hypothetical protein
MDSLSIAGRKQLTMLQQPDAVLDESDEPRWRRQALARVSLLKTRGGVWHALYRGTPAPGFAFEQALVVGRIILLSDEQRSASLDQSSWGAERP